jgi:hypothetical protein
MKNEDDYEWQMTFLLTARQRLQRLLSSYTLQCRSPGGAMSKLAIFLQDKTLRERLIYKDCLCEHCLGFQAVPRMTNLCKIR